MPDPDSLGGLGTSDAAATSVSSRRYWERRVISWNGARNDSRLVNDVQTRLRLHGTLVVFWALPGPEEGRVDSEERRGRMLRTTPCPRTMLRRPIVCLKRRSVKNGAQGVAPFAQNDGRFGARRRVLGITGWIWLMLVTVVGQRTMLGRPIVCPKGWSVRNDGQASHRLPKTMVVFGPSPYAW
jgi:hypothetical protein